jgi:GntR family transcriptional regulator
MRPAVIWRRLSFGTQSPADNRRRTSLDSLIHCNITVNSTGRLDMQLRIQRGSSTPVSRQIDGQIRAQILSGVLQPNDPLPSVRQLARELAVNVNTVFRVYERLAAEGLLVCRHGDGTYVAPRKDSAGEDQLADRRRELAAEFDALARRGMMLGLSPAELRELLAKSLKRARQDVPPPRHTTH